jgi:hypothetical protein
MSAFALVLRSDWQPWLNAPPRVVRLAGLYRLRVGGPFGVESDLAIRIAKHAGYVATFVRGDSKEERIRKTIGTQQWKATGERIAGQNLWLRPTRINRINLKPKVVHDGMSWVFGDPRKQQLSRGAAGA